MDFTMDPENITGKMDHISKANILMATNTDKVNLYHLEMTLYMESGRLAPSPQDILINWMAQK